MKKAVMLMLVAFGTTIAFLAVSEASEKAEQTQTDSSTQATTAGKAEANPHIVFEETEHDFGTLGKQQTVKHTFVFKNEGDDTLVIENIKTTCGCTGTLLSEKEISPGGTGNVEVTFKSGHSGGKKKKSILVYSNDPKSPQVRLYIMADVTIPVEVRPASLYWVAETNVESLRSVELLYRPDLGINIVDLESSSPSFTASVKPNNDAENPSYLIEIDYDGKLPVGTFRETLTVLTDNPEHQKLVVSIRGKVTGPVRIMPDTVNFGVVKDEVTLTRVVRVYSTKQEDFEVTGVEASSPIISTDFSKMGTLNRYEIRVQLKETPPPGAFSEKLLVKTNDPSEDTLEVPVYAFVR